MGRAKQVKNRRDSAKAESSRDRVVATNRRARHDYEILETLECGLQLTGSEVKSLREGRAQITDAYAHVDGHELFLIGAHIPPWTFAVGFGSHDPNRTRKLLAHHDEIDHLARKIETQNLTLVPLRLYFTEGRAKIEIALVRGRTLHDRRQAIAKRDAERDMARAARSAERYA